MRPRSHVPRRILRRALDCAFRDGLPARRVPARIRLHVLFDAVAAANIAPHSGHTVHGRDASERGHRSATGVVASFAAIRVAQSGARWRQGILARLHQAAPL